MERWTRETLRELRVALHTGPPSRALELLRIHPAIDTAHSIATWLIGWIATDVPGARWLGMTIVDALGGSGLEGDVALVIRLQHALDGEEPPDLSLIPVEMDVLAYILEGGHTDYGGHRLHIETGEILSDDPEMIEGLPEPPDWDDYEVWLGLDAIWPRRGWQDLADFIDTVEDPALAERLGDAIRGKGAFRRFKGIVYSTEHEGTRWSLFEDERRLGRARHWLADRGLRPD